MFATATLRPHCPALHPAVRLLAWSGLVLLGQSLTGWQLAMASALGLLLAAIWAPRRLGHLARRTRYLLLSIFILFACGTPGLAWWPLLAALSPTWEGVQLALNHAGQLLLVLALLALLLEFTPPASLVGGVFGLMKPLAGWGRIREKVALRLLLVLQYAEAERSTGQRRSWRDALDWLERGAEQATPEASIRVSAQDLSWADYVVLALLAGALAAYLIGAAS